MPKRRLARASIWASAFVIAVLSLVPGSIRPHTGLDGETEHFIAYAGAGLLFAACVRSALPRVLGWLGFAVAAGGFEIAQMFIPDRSPSIRDAVASVAGITAGMVTGGVAVALFFFLCRARRAARERREVLLVSETPSDAEG